MKLQTHVRTQIKQPEGANSFYPCVIKKTGVASTNGELILLIKVLKYNLNHKTKELDKNPCPRSWDSHNPTPTHEQDHIRYQVAHNITRL